MLMRHTYDYVIFDVQSEDTNMLGSLLASGVFDRFVVVTGNDKLSVGAAVSLMSGMATFGDHRMVATAQVIMNRYFDRGAITIQDAARIFNRKPEAIATLKDESEIYDTSEHDGNPAVLLSRNIMEEFQHLADRIC
jgi:nitrogenase subunit NifH